MTRYNDKLDPDDQISAEEEIAAYLFEEFRDDGFNEETANEAGKAILLKILKRFRPDLCVEES